MQPQDGLWRACLVLSDGTALAAIAANAWARGRLQAAAQLCRAAVAAGDPNAPTYLLVLLEQAGDHTGVEQLA